MDFLRHWPLHCSCARHWSKHLKLYLSSWSHSMTSNNDCISLPFWLQHELELSVWESWEIKHKVELAPLKVITCRVLCRHKRMLCFRNRRQQRSGIWQPRIRRALSRFRENANTITRHYFTAVWKIPDQAFLLHPLFYLWSHHELEQWGHRRYW